MVQLQGVDFGNVFTASGVLNFFGLSNNSKKRIGRGWWYHHFFKLMPGFNFSNSTFISKTCTVSAYQGNLMLNENLQPKKRIPNCIKIYPFKKTVLNAVGLSNPGLVALLETGQWQARTSPFVISFSMVGPDLKSRQAELIKFKKLMTQALADFKTKIAFELNISCPNTENDLKVISLETSFLLPQLADLGAPLIVKMSCHTPLNHILTIADSSHCDALSLSNTIPWGELPERINWPYYFPSLNSPLAKYGNGSLSGRPLLMLTAEKIFQLREYGVKKTIIAGGGIFTKEDIDFYKTIGADGIALASVVLLRPYRLRSLIDYGNQVFKA